MTIKKLMISGAATAVMLGSTIAPAFAAPTVSDNANGNACFGQARAYYAQHGPNGALSPETNGSYISERKGDNPQINAQYIEDNC